MKIATIIQGPHKLFTGANGHITYGIKVRSIRSEEESNRRGLKYEWYINDYTLTKSPITQVRDALGLTDDEALKLRADILALVESQQ